MHDVYVTHFISKNRHRCKKNNLFNDKISHNTISTYLINTFLQEQNKNSAQKIIQTIHKHNILNMILCC